MSRTELLQRLQSQEAVSSETCFVLLWTYLNMARVAAGESMARVQRVHPFEIRLQRKPSLRNRLLDPVREISTHEGEAFDLYALQWLSALDDLLNKRQEDRLGQTWVAGIDGMEYRVRRRNHFLADLFERQVTTKEDQSGTRDLYARFHAAVPRSVEGIDIDVKAEVDWAGPSLGHRLRREREKRRLNVMLWPLETVLDYPALHGEPKDFVSLDSLSNEDALELEVRSALATARSLEVSILVFPELAIPTQTREVIRRTLAGHGPDGYPLLTLFGCCHRRAPEGGDFNEAVLLGPAGAELCCHKKLTSFTHIVNRDRTLFVAEQLRTGTTVYVLESAFGNLTPLICLDFIHKPLSRVLTQIHSNLFLVPSLSHNTSAHQTAAMDLQVDNRASSFVSNRSIGGLTQTGTSFFRVPCPDGFDAHLPHYRRSPFLLFSLRDLLDKTAK
ncbi:MAG TPA: hypothetical protein VH394_31405 [Thermoanaerobaculia bacterium]|jgi:hypothetical protein|nr:hypothetical protein [Thermoanaerobaculia bacterium]